MSKVVSLTEVRLAPVPSVVAALEDAVERARRGEIRGYVLACSSDGGSDATSYQIGDGAISTLVLAIERAKLRLLSHGE